MLSLFRHVTLSRVAVSAWLILGAALIVKNLVSPDSHSLYPIYAQTAREFAGAAKTCYSVQHLPYFADVLYPFSRFPDWLGSNLWLFASLTALLTGLKAFIARFWPDDQRGRAPAAIFLVVIPIALTSLGNNQANILIAGCLLWGAVAIRDGRWWIAAACLALPGFKMYPLALGILYSALFPRRFAWRFACAVGLIVVCPYAFHPAALVSERYRDVAEYVTSDIHYRTYSFMNVRDFLVYCGWPIAPKRFVAVQLFAGAAILGGLFWGRRRGLNDSAVILHGFALTSLWFVTFGPSVESQTYLLVAPTVAWLLVEAWCRNRISAASMGMAATVMAIGPLQTSVFGLAVQRTMIEAKIACPVLVAIWFCQFVAVFQQPAIPQKGEMGRVSFWSAANDRRLFGSNSAAMNRRTPK